MHCADHTFSVKPEDTFLLQELICEITDDEINTLERQTVGLHTNATWRRQHTLKLLLHIL